MARKYQLDTPEPKKGQRVTLTKAQAESPIGRQLVGLLKQITQDGNITAEEIESLYSWLTSVDADIPALRFLRTLIETIAEDGVITPGEAYDLYVAIERVLPANVRYIAQNNRESAGVLEPDRAQFDSWEDDPITGPQENYLKSLGADPRKFKTKGEASREIDRLTSSPVSVSNRQLMVLRFWNVVHLAERGKSHVIEWLDVFYAHDADHIAAWNLWKEENDDRGRQDDPNRVPIGIGPYYLKKVKTGTRKGVDLTTKILVGIIIVGILIIIVALLLPRP